MRKAMELLVVLGIAGCATLYGLGQLCTPASKAGEARRTLELIANLSRVQQSAGKGYAIGAINGTNPFASQGELQAFDWQNSPYYFSGADRAQGACVLGRAVRKDDAKSGYCADTTGKVADLDANGECPLAKECSTPMGQQATMVASLPASQTAVAWTGASTLPANDMRDAAASGSAPAEAPAAGSADSGQPQTLMAAMVPVAGMGVPVAAVERPRPQIPALEEPTDETVPGFNSFLIFDLAGNGIHTYPGSRTMDGLAAGVAVAGVQRADAFEPFSGFGGLRGVVRRAIADGVLDEGVWQKAALSTGDLDRLSENYGLRLQVAGGRVVSFVEAGVSELSLSMPPSSQSLNFDGRGNMISYEEGAQFIKLNGHRGRYYNVGLRDRRLSGERGGEN